MTKIEHELNFGMISKKYAPRKAKKVKGRKIYRPGYCVHIFFILVYFTVLSAQFMRLVLHISFDPDPKTYPYDRHDVCDRDPQLMGLKCIYLHRPNDYLLDILLVVFCVFFFLYAQCVIRKTDKKSLWVASILIRILSLCCMFSVPLFGDFILAIIVILMWFPGIIVLAIMALVFFLLCKYSTDKKLMPRIPTKYSKLKHNISKRKYYLNITLIYIYFIQFLYSLCTPYEMSTTEHSPFFSPIIPFIRMSRNSLPTFQTLIFCIIIIAYSVYLFKIKSQAFTNISVIMIFSTTFYLFSLSMIALKITPCIILLLTLGVLYNVNMNIEPKMKLFAPLFSPPQRFFGDPFYQLVSKVARPNLLTNTQLIHIIYLFWLIVALEIFHLAFKCIKSSMFLILVSS